MITTKVAVFALALSISVLPALAQDASSGSASTTPAASGTSTPPPLPEGMPSNYTQGSTVTTGTYGQNLLPEGNPLNGLFTPQPQYPTAQTQMNQASPPIPSQYGSNPLNGLFTGQPQYPTAQTVANPQVSPPGQTNNMLQGVFTGQNPFQTPQTPQNPQPQAGFALPGFGQPKLEELKNQGIQYKVDDPNAPKDPNDYPGRVPDPKPAAAAAGGDKDKKADAKDAKADKDKDGKAKDKDAKTADKDKDKDKDGKTADKKDGDKKDADADKDKTADGDKDKDAKADADADKDKDKDKDKDEAATKPSGPYNPLKDALVLLNAGQAQQAIEVLGPFLKAHPTNAEGHYLAGIAFVNLRDFNMAAAEYRVVLHLVPATQLASLAVEGLRKIGMPALVSRDNPGAKLPPLRSGK